MPLILGANSLAGGYQVKNSARFNHNSSDYLNRTPASAGNRKIFTYSFWTKRSEGGSAYPVLFDNGSNSSNRDSFFFNKSTGDFLQLYCESGGSVFMDLATTQLFRDFSAWYHIVLAVDTTQATASNRIKLYVNGSQVTELRTATYPSQNTDMNTNSTNPFRIGGSNSTSYYYDGYLSDYYFIDGQALTPSSFGETDEDSGIWKPKAYTGTFGTNGFYLQFKNSASLGTDSSGNGNTFTVNNLTSIDQTTDTPTNNWCTINSVAVNTANIPTMTDGNLTALSTTGSNASLLGTIAVGSGKWYYEVKCISGTGGDRVAKVGWGNPDKSPAYQYQASIVYRNSDGNKYIDNSGSSYGATWTDNDIIGVALDISGGTVTFYKNGTTQGNITISGALDDGTFYIPYADVANTDKLSFNFGNPPYSANSYADANGYGNFSYQVPANYLALCTKNLATNG